MSDLQASDPYSAFHGMRRRQQEDARRAADWRIARDLAKSQRVARTAEQPGRDELVQGPSVPVGHVIKIWWRTALRSVRVAH